MNVVCRSRGWRRLRTHQEGTNAHDRAQPYTGMSLDLSSPCPDGCWPEGLKCEGLPLTTHTTVRFELQR